MYVPFLKTRYWSKVANFYLPLLYLATLLGVTPLEFHQDLWLQKTRVCRLATALITVRLFLPRNGNAMLARYMASSCVCLSVCLSQVGDLLKRLNAESRKQRHTITRDSSFLMPKTSAKLKLGHPQRRRQNAV